MNKINFQLKQRIFKRDNFKCQKCNFRDPTVQDLEAHHIKSRVFGGKDQLNNLITLCSICHFYSPDSEKEFINYLNEKIDGKILNTFRKSQKSISKKTSKGMNNLFQKGNHLTKAPKGYKLVDKQLVPNEDSENLSRIFEKFFNQNISLTQLAKENNMTASGMKKLLQNTTYIGKVKFAHEESQGNHQPILSKQLFEQVQDKIKQLGWTK